MNNDTGKIQAGTGALIEKALADGGLELAERTAHSIKGNADIIGASSLGEAASLLERTCPSEFVRQPGGHVIKIFPRPGLFQETAGKEVPVYRHQGQVPIHIPV